MNLMTCSSCVGPSVGPSPLDEMLGTLFFAGHSILGGHVKPDTMSPLYRLSPDSLSNCRLLEGEPLLTYQADARLTGYHYQDRQHPSH
ncbi:uncharacterized [Tachysurus ichikawai]